jgi:membrane-associated protease RseP (regulator of RpoE activity)
MDRARLVSAQAQQERGIVRRSLERLVGLAVVIGGAALKWGFLFGKFFAVFVSFAVYSYLFHSWEFGLGLVLLIFVHEMGHFAEAKRQRLHVTLPTFIPFFGAYVMVQRENLTPWRSSLVSLAGPFVGSLGALVAWGASAFGDARLLVGIASIGFFLNAFNLLPIGFLDGGTVARAIGEERRGWIRHENGVPVEAVPPNPSRARLIAALYVLLAVAIVLGLLATRQSGTTL